ncbi:MAG TPA: hypothetical protein VKD02_06635 [Methyloceanibacter sp.]|nr:hypothetical protein [Methyloceanibacter sp.]
MSATKLTLSPSRIGGVARPHVALRRLDLDHIGAHVGEQRAGERAGDEIRQLDDPNSR